MNVHRRAVILLSIATAAWGLSFCTAKAAMDVQKGALPGHADWFHAALILFNRMVISTVVMVLWVGRRMRRLTRLEVRQGIELGLFGGIGMLLQTDAQNYIDASVSAFFTQFTCVFVPLVVALRARRAPPLIVILACGMVMAGCVVLSKVDFGKIGFGRGEWETLISALFFTGQILCLERREFHQNDMRRTAAVMFAVKGVLMLPLVLVGGGLGTLRVYQSGPAVTLALLLALACTVYAYGTMLRWQPHVSATQAGLIYATEPVFAAAWALFLPAWFSGWANIAYANEQLTKELFWGGGLMLAANLLLIFRPMQPPHGNVPPAA
jgi:drug/metabolite transporter (DMT)-like permease